MGSAAESPKPFRAGALRRKLLLILWVLTGMLMLLAVGALITLEGVFSDLERLNAQVGAVVHDADELAMLTTSAEVNLRHMENGRREGDAEALAEAATRIREIAEDLEARHAVDDAQLAPVHRRLVAASRAFEQRAAALATANLDERASRAAALLGDAAHLREDALTFLRHAQERLFHARKALTSRFRWIVIAMALAFLGVINLSFLLLLHAANMILRPVDKLIEASRKLALEQFDHRVAVAQSDEFDELGRAFNHLAEQLQENEKRKLEMLGLAAVTLNHELNNAIGTIELQLALLKRQTGGQSGPEKCLRQIHENLRHMSEVVTSLKQVRRIVVTDYAAGLKMLDLKGSVQEEAPMAAPTAMANPHETAVPAAPSGR